MKKSFLFWLSIFLIVSVVLTGCGGQPAGDKEVGEATDEAVEQPSDDLAAAAEFYDGKIIKFICPWAAGGVGYDLYARMIAPYLEKYSGARVVVENVTGAGGLTGTNTIYRSPNDGLTIGIGNGSGLVNNVICGVEGVVFDLEKFTWLARITDDLSRILVVLPDSPFQSIEDIWNSDRTFRFGATGLGGSSYVDAVFINLGLELNAEMIHGYDGSALVEAAMLRGDVDGMVGSWTARRGLIESGEHLAILQGGPERLKELPDVPTWHELAKTETGKRLFEQIDIVNLPGRVLLGPPGIPEERVAFLRDALYKALNDPDYIKEMAEMQMDLNYDTGEETYKNVLKALEMPDDIKQLFIKASLGEL